MALLEWRFTFDKPADAYIKGLSKVKFGGVEIKMMIFFDFLFTFGLVLVYILRKELR